MPGTLWSQGHFRRGICIDYDKDGTEEIFIGGINNAMENAFVLSVDFDKINGQTPNKKENLFDDIPIAELNKYLLLAKTDVLKYQLKRFNGVHNTNYERSSDDLVVNVTEGEIMQPLGFVYRFDTDFSNVRIQIGDEYQFIRDSLISLSILQPPRTTTPEYEQLVINSIREWDGEEFVKFEGRE